MTPFKRRSCENVLAGSVSPLRSLAHSKACWEDWQPARTRAGGEREGWRSWGPQRTACWRDSDTTGWDKWGLSVESTGCQEVGPGLATQHLKCGPQNREPPQHA